MLPNGGMVDRGFALCESEMPKRRTATELDSAFVPSPDSPASSGAGFLGGGAAPTLNRAIRCHRNTFLTSALSLGNSIAIRPIAPEREYGFSAPTSIDRSAA